MKKFVKVFGAAVLMATMLLNMTGCDFKTIKEVRTAGDEIMECAFDLDSKKLIKHMNEDDKDYDFQVLFYEDILDEMDDMDAQLTNMHSKSTKIDINKDEATIHYLYPMKNGEEYEFTLELEKDGKDWIIADNEAFIEDYIGFNMEIHYDGPKDDKQVVKDIMEDYDVNKPSKIGKATYEYAKEQFEMWGY